MRQSQPGHAAYVPPLAVLLVRSGRAAGHRLTIWQSSVTIGSGPQADLGIDDATVGALQARVELRQGVWSLTVLDRSRAIRVDGETVTGEMPLSPGSTIQLGEAALLFEPRDRGDPGSELRSEGKGRTPGEAPPRSPRRLGFLLLVVLGLLLLLGGLGLEFAR